MSDGTWQQRQQQQLGVDAGKFDAVLSGLASSGVSFNVPWSMNDRRRYMRREHGVLLPTAFSRPSGWAVEKWTEESGMFWQDGKWKVQFPGSEPARGRAHGPNLYIAQADDYQHAQRIRDLFVEALLGVGSSLCRDNKGDFSEEDLLGACAFVLQAAATGMPGAAFLAQHLCDNSDLLPVLASDSSSSSSSMEGAACSASGDNDNDAADSGATAAGAAVVAADAVAEAAAIAAAAEAAATAAAAAHAAAAANAAAAAGGGGSGGFGSAPGSMLVLADAAAPSAAPPQPLFAQAGSDGDAAAATAAGAVEAGWV
jgi:hypothetical protein